MRDVIITCYYLGPVIYFRTTVPPLTTRIKVMLTVMGREMLATTALKDTTPLKKTVMRMALETCVI